MSYLLVSGRLVEGYDAARRYAHSASVARSGPERASAYALLGDADWDRRRALSSALIAIDADPRQLIVWEAPASYSMHLGHDQAMVDFARRGLATNRQDQPDSQQAAYAWVVALDRTYIDVATGDFAALRSDYQVYDRRPGIELPEYYAERVQVAALLHEEARSRQELALALAAAPADPTVLEARWDVSAAAGDWTAALEAAKALVADREAQVKSPSR